MEKQQWNGKYFIPTSLKALGLSIQLNHRGQSRCPNPETCALFTIIDVDAIHGIRVDFCACGHGAQSRHVQLLRAGLFPVTSEDPKMAITFRTLELFEILSYESKVSIFEYHCTLMRLTDNTGMNKPPVRLNLPFLVNFTDHFHRTGIQPSTAPFGSGVTSKC